MPTSEEWEGMGRKVDMKIETIEPSDAYDKGFAEGVDWATPRIWNEAIEAAAMEVDRSLIRKNITDALSAEIRKLKKP